MAMARHDGGLAFLRSAWPRTTKFTLSSAGGGFAHPLSSSNYHFGGPVGTSPCSDALPPRSHEHT
eukprot:scaffold315479_cov23-Tisochrysis_lutea.AAC.2